MQSDGFLKGLIDLSCDPGILLLSMHPRITKIHVYTKTATLMFIATLCIIDKNKVNEWRMNGLIKCAVSIQ